MPSLLCGVWGSLVRSLKNCGEIFLRKDLRRFSVRTVAACASKRFVGIEFFAPFYVVVCQICNFFPGHHAIVIKIEFSWEASGQ